MADDASATSSPISNDLDAERSERATLIALLAMLFYQGFAVSIVGIASPWIGKSFHLDGAGIARLFAWISASALGALALSRMIDRFGRRRMIVWCLAAMPVCSIGAAVSTNLIAFTAFQIALFAFVGAAGSGCIVMLSETLPIDRRATGQSMGGRYRRHDRHSLSRNYDAAICGERMVVAMDAGPACCRRNRDAPNNGADAPRERPMATRRRRGRHREVTLL